MQSQALRELLAGRGSGIDEPMGFTDHLAPEPMNTTKLLDIFVKCRFESLLA